MFQESHLLPRRPKMPVLMLCTCLLGITLLGGCDWDEKREKVLERMCDTITTWYNRTWRACKAIEDPKKRDDCFLRLAADNTTLTAKKVDALAAYDDCNAEAWKLAVDGIKAVLEASAKALTKNFANPLGRNGQTDMRMAARFDGNGYPFDPNSQLGYQFDGSEMRFTQVRGGFRLAIEPDGQGGWRGQVQDFLMEFDLGGEPAALQQAGDGQPSSVVIGRDGQGVMALHVNVHSEWLGDPVLWMELPLQSQNPLQFVQINTFGPVPGELVFPVFEIDPDDCNGNGVPDLIDINRGDSQDCDGDLVPDECQLGAEDCNNNSVLDHCDIASGFSQDQNNNGFPDECEAFPQGCEAIKKMKVKLKNKRGRFDIKTVIKSSLPEGTIVTLTVDGYGNTQHVALNRKGKAKVTFTDVGEGAHEVCLDQCDRCQIVGG